MNDFSGAGYSSGQVSHMSDMDVVTRESPIEKQQNSEITTSTITSTGLSVHGQNIVKNVHKYPLHLDSSHNSVDKSIPSVSECVYFTVIKKGGLSFQTNADSSEAVAKAEAKAINTTDSKSNKSYDYAGANYGSGHEGGGIKKTTEGADAGIAQKAIQAGDKIKESAIGQMAADAWQGLVEGAGGAMKTAWKNVTAKDKILEHCFLYMPTSVQYSEGASWGADALGGLGNFLSDSIKKAPGVDDVGNILKNFGAAAALPVAGTAAVGAGAAITKFAKMGALIGALGTGSLLGGAGAGIKHGLRIQNNPYEEQMFNGIDFRTFSFDFTFSATNADEYREVNNIIKMFRKNSRPGYIATEVDSMYTFPHEFGIKFLRLDNAQNSYVNNEVLPLIHNCVCTKVDTNFTPDSEWIAHSDGKPITISLSLGFTETIKNSQNEIEAGY